MSRCEETALSHVHSRTPGRTHAPPEKVVVMWLCGYVLMADSLLCGLHAGRVAARIWRIASWWWVGLTVSGEGRGLGHGAWGVGLGMGHGACACAWDWAWAVYEHGACAWA